MPTSADAALFRSKIFGELGELKQCDVQRVGIVTKLSVYGHLAHDGGSHKDDKTRLIYSKRESIAVARV